MYEQESLLREHGKEITDIIEAMKEGPENEEVINRPLPQIYIVSVNRPS